MKKLQEFLKNHLRKIILGILIALAVVHFIINFELVQNTKLIEQSWINFINGYILVTTMSLAFIFLIWIAFLMHRETAKELEKFLLKNLTTACFLLVLFLLLQGKTFGLEGQGILTAIGAIIVFWYGYKTYERDKEIQMIERYSEKYNSIKTKLINTTDVKERDYAELLTLWYEEYFLFEKGYISSELWDEWKFWIQEDTASFLYEAQDTFGKLVQEYQKKELPPEDWFFYCLDTSTFLDSVFMTYAFKEKDKILIKDEFGKFLTNLMKNLFEEKKELNYVYHNKDWIIGMNSLFNQINN